MNNNGAGIALQNQKQTQNKGQNKMVQVTESTPTTQFTIQGVVFTAPQPYGEGYTLTAGEANALNQVLVENLRNNFASHVKKAIGDAGSIEALSEETKAELAAAFAEYAAGYEFGIRKAGTAGATRLDPVEKEAITLAKNTIKDAIRKQGHTLKDFPAEQINELATKFLAKNPAVYDIARKNVEARQSVVGGQFDLEDLIAA